MKNAFGVDVAVLLVFFNRPVTFAPVFEEVRKARPSRLFLYQDGPRSPSDMPGVEECRRIASDENIDWECDVRRFYQDTNKGCDPSGYIAHRWAFSQADKCIVIEDDVLVSRSFFRFCAEMLVRYEDDERITMIAGFNTDGETTDVDADYFFTSTFSIWGWASWARVVNAWDGGYSFVRDKEAMSRLTALVKDRRIRKDFIPMCRRHAASGKEHFESIFWGHMLLNSGLAVMPAKNMVRNIGAMPDSTHFSSELETMPRGIRRMFTMGSFDVTFPLRHPNYVVDHVAYKDRLYRRNAWGHPARKVSYSIEELLLNIRKGRWANISKALRRRVGKWMAALGA